LRTTEIRLLCVKWQIAGVHRDNRDLVFTYRSAERAAQLTGLSCGRLKVVDEKSIYLRLKAEDRDDPEGLYKLLVDVLKPTANGAA
jgi:transcription-repair coupling factor (superfamily II helicase)